MPTEDDTVLHIKDDSEYGECPEQSLWWEEEYDLPDYPMYIPNNTDDDFDWREETLNA